MSTHKNIDKICVAILVLAIVLTVLFMNAGRFGVRVVVDEDAEAYSDSAYFTANDLDGNWDTSDATRITLNGTDCEADGPGVYSYDGNVVIATTGKYVISGTLDDGSIIVDAYDASKVWIMLDGVSVNCNDDAAFRVDQADKVFLTLADGTENTFTSGEEYSDEALDDGTDGAIFTHDDLTINGSGSLYVVANYRHGIEANDDLVITGGTIAIDAPADAININNNFRMRDAYISLACEDDGVVIKKEDDGYLYMESGTLDITSKDDGINAAGEVTIAGGELTIAAGDDGIHSDTAIAVSDGTILLSECYEGMEAVTIDINGGDITVYPTDDGINANGGSGDMMGGFGGGMGGGPGGGPPDMNGNGAVTPSEVGDASNNGFPNENAPADMENASNKNEDANEGDDVNADTDDDEETYVKITDGTITIINETGQDADGIDSNGDILITGGAIRVSLPGDGSNNALDYGSESGGICKIDGGEVVACGGSAMLEEISTTSEQCSVMYNTEDTVAAGTEVALQDADGKVLLAYDVPCSYSSVVLSCADMKQDQTYQVRVGGEIAEEVTLEETATTIGSAQNDMFGGGMGGRGGFFQMQQGGDAQQSDGGQGDPAERQEMRLPENAVSPSTVNGADMQMPGGNGGPPDFANEAETSEEDAEEETVVDTRVDIRELDADAKMLLGASAVVLLAGLIFARLYKRRRL